MEEKIKQILEKLNEQLQDSQNQIDTIKNKIREVENISVRDSQDEKEKQEELKSRNEELSKVQDENAELKNKIQQYEDYNKIINENRKIIDNEILRKESLLKDKKQLEEEINKRVSEKEKASYKKDIDKIDKELLDVEKKLNDARIEISKIVSRVNIKYSEIKKASIKWHSDLTQEQIDDLRAEGIEPGDQEYDMYLRSHGINSDKNVIKNEPEKQPEKQPENAIPISQATPVSQATKSQTQKGTFIIKYDGKQNKYSYKNVYGDEVTKQGERKGMASLFNRKKKDNMLISIIGQENFDDIFKNVNRRKVKHYDAALIGILYQNLGIDACKKYLEELSKGVNADYNKLPYSMEYDLTNLDKAIGEDGKKLGGLLKNNIETMVMRNEHVADVKERRKGLAKDLMKPLAFLLGLVAGVSALVINNDKKQEKLPKGNVIQTLENDTTKTNNKQPEGPTWRDILRQTESKEESKEVKEENKKILLGSIIELPEGINYNETSTLDGENSGTIGKNQWRKSGEYMIDGISIVNGDEIVDYKYSIDPEFDIEKYISDNTKNGEKVRYHISEGNECIQKENGTYVGSRPTGWVDKAEIEKSIQKNKQDNTLEEDFVR
ncbi:MAG: hypothetical protein E7313_05700 [Clostridiales bacterium]|nr:hypothetical protein [Clostridiales bacterium]